MECIVNNYNCITEDTFLIVLACIFIGLVIYLFFSLLFEVIEVNKND